MRAPDENAVQFAVAGRQKKGKHEISVKAIISMIMGPAKKTSITQLKTLSNNKVYVEDSVPGRAEWGRGVSSSKMGR